jgi:LPXTG-motif cell wall-anchored protein
VNRHRSELAVLLGLGAALLVSAAPVFAGKAVSIDVGTIAVRELLVPGGEYRLPTFGVRNPGTEPTAYVVAVSYVDGQEKLRPPASWFTFSPSSFSLEVGASRPVEARLTIPTDAEPGDYEALIGPQIVADGAGASVGAGAAARLSFTIEPSSALDAFLRQVFRFLAENPWVLVVAGLALLLLILWLLRRRFSISIARRPS